MQIRNWVIIAVSVAAGCAAACSSGGAVNRTTHTDGGTSDSSAGGGTGPGQLDDASFTVINEGVDAAPAADGALPDIHIVVLGPGVTTTDVTTFEAAPAGTCTGPRIDYPLEGAVMPRNVFPPKIMWTPGQAAQATDLYRVRLKRPNAVLEAYLLSPATNSWQPATDSFTPFANRNVGETIDLTVTLLRSGSTCQGASTFKTVDAFIAGSVYYWSPVRTPVARIVRVDVDKGQLVDFMPNPGTCLGCHAVTRDGRRMATYNELMAAVAGYDLTANLTASPPPTLYSAAKGLGEHISAFNGDGTRLLLTPSNPRLRNNCGGQFTLYSGTTGQPVTATGLSQVTAGADPEWSPDSSAIAYSAAGALMLLPQTAPDTFGAPVSLGGVGVYDWHPTWTPDSKWLGYQHGSGCNTTVRSGSFITGSIWFTSKAGTGNVLLKNLNGGRTDNWRPVFSPFDSGGYFWVVYSTTRPYGNAAAGVSGQQQLWIAAVHDQPTGMADPSEVPYYLDGQEPVSNIQAYWAPAPCQVYSGACETDGQCCSPVCQRHLRQLPLET